MQSRLHGAEGVESVHPGSILFSLPHFQKMRNHPNQKQVKPDGEDL